MGYNDKKPFTAVGFVCSLLFLPLALLANCSDPIPEIAGHQSGSLGMKRGMMMLMVEGPSPPWKQEHIHSHCVVYVYGEESPEWIKFALKNLHNFFFQTPKNVR